MGEVVVSSEAVTTAAMDVVENNRTTEGAAGTTTTPTGSGSSNNVMWERFLPKMVVRVLLVEADDSTRQIIAALLRKCSYKVAAVSDGLKAWEVLKGRSHNIDLILTEVDLPSISGYALLTLIMEHDVCKNIPVIMMSSNDSVSTVYKCMLRGAADFLVKPVRKNELRNLWQHVWRKQASSGAAGPGPPDASEAQQKVEATAENNAVSNHSSGYAASLQRNRECIEKGSDAQSSCTKPELETVGANDEQVRCPSPQKSATLLSDNTNIPTREEFGQESRRRGARDNGAKTQAHDSQAAASIDALAHAQDKNFDDCSKQANIIGQDLGNNHSLEDSAREAIDLIGAFDNYLKGNLIRSASNASTNKFDILPLLDLSLRRSIPSASVNQVNDEMHRLNHSDASAFSRYVTKPLQACTSTSPSACNQQKDQETNSEKQQSNYPDYNSDAHGTQNHLPVATNQAGPPEILFPYPQKKEISLPIPVRGVRFENVTDAYGSLISQVYCTQSGLSPMPNQGAAHHSDSFAQMNSFYSSDHQPSSSQQFHNLMDQRTSDAVDHMGNKHDQKLEHLEEWGNVSSANDQSGNSSFCNVNISHHYSARPGINAMSGVNTPSECGNEEGFYVHEGASNRLTQREAALTKFRLKRKERCFDKKVRYESRKKLAEQRPRVKGQFVRQVTNDSQPGNSSAD